MANRDVTMPSDTDSSEFPHFEGSFVLRSSDGVLFHTQRYLLEHVSGLFRDMFSLPESTDSSSSSSPLPINLDSSTLTDLLCLIDPNRDNPSMKTSTLPHLIEAGRFYRIPCIFKWFETTAIRTISDVLGNTEEPFVKKHPLVCLNLSLKLGIKNCLQASICELAQCSTEKLMERGVSVDFRLFHYCLELRRLNTNRFKNLILQLAPDTQQDRMGNVKQGIDRACAFCTVARARWFSKLTTIAFESPSWTDMTHILYAFPTCTSFSSSCGREFWVSHMEKVIASHKTTHQHLSLQHPEVPPWLEEELESNIAMNPTLG